MKRKLIVFVCSILMIYNVSNAQENYDSTQTNNFALSLDLVSSYVWRGLVFSDAPNLQPYLAFTNNKGNFTVGAWGSYSLADYFSEVDIFASYSISNFTITLTDYFVMSQQLNNHFFNFENETTNHALEGSFTYNGPESFPIQLLVATFFYGFDKNAQGDNNFSTYFEASYPFKWKKNNLDVFMGMTPGEGLYADYFAVTNIGISNSREVKINDRLSIPIKGSLIINPNLENIYLVLAITFAANN
ncbi:MAG: hypothetical protein P1P88_19425 [Bacteroidales bacterium]|nr:hypothetical protein [Bacteroidales bacterium]